MVSDDLTRIEKCWFICFLSSCIYVHLPVWHDPAQSGPWNVAWARTVMRNKWKWIKIKFTTSPNVLIIIVCCRVFAGVRPVLLNYEHANVLKTNVDIFVKNCVMKLEKHSTVHRRYDINLSSHPKINKIHFRRISLEICRTQVYHLNAEIQRNIYKHGIIPSW